MHVGVYVINLDRSVDRWEAISLQAHRCGMEIVRVAAVDGAAVAPHDYVDVDRQRFLRHGARTLLPGEYGCYRSHLECLARFLDSRFDAALIMEDDVQPTADLLDRARAILETDTGADLVKLYNHRSRSFLPIATSKLGDRIGVCLHGPQGSAACYAITRDGAERMIAALQVICFPYDVALERSWGHGVRVFSVRENIATLGALCKQTQIASRTEYRRHKIGGLHRMITHVHRSVEYARRIAYSIAVLKGRRPRLFPPSRRQA